MVQHGHQHTTSHSATPTTTSKVPTSSSGHSIGSNTSSIKSNDSIKNLEDDIKQVELNQPPPIATRPEKTKSIYTQPVDEDDCDPNLAKENLICSENSGSAGSGKAVSEISSNQDA